MGLDLCHYKALMEAAPDPGDEYMLFPPEELPPGALDQYGFDRYVRDHRIPQIVHFAYFYRHEGSARRDNPFPWSIDGPDDTSKWIGTPESNERALGELEQRLGLDRSRATLSEKVVRRGAILYRRTTLSYWGYVIERGVFVVEVGYQRKGMSESFYEHFDGRGGIFFAEEDFRVLEDCLIPERRDELMPNLRANFIDNYERGRSLLYLG